MQVNISGQHVEITSALKKYIMEKIEKLNNHFNHITNVHVTISVEKKIRQKAEAQVNLSGAQIHAEAIHEDMYTAIDAMIDKLDRQVVKHKEKLKDHGKGEQDLLNNE
jgi:putative sigma-54 modulation protein